MKDLPAPTEITCISVEKVYDECIHTQVEEILIEFETEEDNLEAQCAFVEVLEEKCQVIKEGFVKVTATLEVACKLNGLKESEEFTIAKTFRLPRAGERGLEVDCKILPECLKCFVSDREEDEEEIFTVVTACVGILIILKLVAKVQLLIPAIGYCPEPPECEKVEDICPDFNPPWPPYPPQDR